MVKKKLKLSKKLTRRVKFGTGKGRFTVKVESDQITVDKNREIAINKRNIGILVSKNCTYMTLSKETISHLEGKSIDQVAATLDMYSDISK